MFKRIQNLMHKRPFYGRLVVMHKKANPLTQKIAYLILMMALISGADEVTGNGSYKVYAAERQVQTTADENSVIVFPCASSKSMVVFTSGMNPELDCIPEKEAEINSDEEFRILTEIEYGEENGIVYITEDINNEEEEAVADEAVQEVAEQETVSEPEPVPEETHAPAPEPEKLEPVYINNPSLVINLTNDELVLFQKLVECEAGGEDMVGKILVANVVINRVNSGRFPNTVSGVINSPRQFSPVSTGIIYGKTPSSDTIEAVNRALSGEDYSNGATYFIYRKGCSAGTASWFDTLNKVVEHGNHEFFKDW